MFLFKTKYRALQEAHEKRIDNLLTIIRNLLTLKVETIEKVPLIFSIRIKKEELLLLSKEEAIQLYTSLFEEKVREIYE